MSAGLNRTTGTSRRLSSVISMSAVMPSASVSTRTGLSENDEAPSGPLRRGAPPYVAIKVATETPSLNVCAGHSVAVILPEYSAIRLPLSVAAGDEPDTPLLRAVHGDAAGKDSACRARRCRGCFADRPRVLIPRLPSITWFL